MTFLAVVLLLLPLTLTLQMDVKEGKSEMEENRKDAESRMRASLGKVYRTVLIDPLRELSELEAAGKEDLDTISSFAGPGDKGEATRRSLEFWKGEMEKVIKPYITSPEKYQGLIIDHAHLSDDPTWNNTAAYKKIEKELNEHAVEAFTKIDNELKKFSGPAKSLGDVTETSWRRLQAKRAQDLAVFLISLSRQFAKNEAASGGAAQESFTRLNDAILKDTKDFMEKIQEIYK